MEHRKTDTLAVAVISVYAITAGVRVMAQVEPRNYAIFYNSALFVVFLFVLVRVINHATRGRTSAAESRLPLGLAFLQVA